MNRTSLVLAGLVTALAAVSASMAAPALNQTYNWTMELKTQEMPLHFEYQGSTLRHVVKAELKYFKTGEESTGMLYEHLWFANDKTLGLERKNKLTIPGGEGVAIKVTHSSDDAGSEERRASAKAIMNAVADIVVCNSMVATIKVPSASFTTICSEIEQYNFHPQEALPNEEINSDMSLFVESDAGEKKTLYHFN